MGAKAFFVPLCVAVLVAGCGSSSDEAETGSNTETVRTLSNEQRAEAITEYLRLPQFDREVTDLIELVSVETDTAKVVFEPTDDREIPYDRYCEAVLESGYVEHAEVYADSDSDDPAAECP